MNKKQMGLRLLWIIPNVFLYIVFIGLTIFLNTNASGFIEINRLEIWIFMLTLLLLVAMFGSYRIYKWIKNGDL